MKNSVLFLLAILFSGTLLPTASRAAADYTTPQPVSLDENPVKQPKLKIIHGDKSVQFSPAELEHLGSYRLHTASFWYEGRRVFEGPLFRDVLKAAGIDQVKAVRITAHDDYSQIIPQQDWLEWPTLIATREDGKPLSLKDKGPYRLIYPQNMNPELENIRYRPRWVWVIRTIEVVEP